jgi:hypothetical protein
MHKTILNHAAADQRRKKRERRRKKEEGRKKEKEEGTAQGSCRRLPRWISPALALPDLAGSRRRPTVCVCVFFFSWPWVCETHGFFFSRQWVSQPHLAVAVPHHRSTQTPRGDPPHNKSTTGHRDPRLGLDGRGSDFFLVLG